MRTLFFIVTLTLSSNVLWADEVATVQPGKVTTLPVVEFSLRDFNPFEAIRIPNASDLQATFSYQTPVKSQERRGTCSIFSTTAIVESLIKRIYQKELDLSENYLQYLVMARVKPVANEGSDIPMNLPAIQRWGTIEEKDWPYEPYDWNSASLPEEEEARKQATCGHLSSDLLTRCWLAHRDPRLDPQSAVAAQFRVSYSTHQMRYAPTNSLRQIKNRLSAGWPMVLSLEFFYGAWNHRKMTELGIGERDMQAWERGYVSVPNEIDIKLSRTSPAGHSIVIIGYDDAKRVYYFKNSWGTSSFGVKSDFFGEGTSQGYGTISYEYANRFGTFYDVFYR